MRRSFSSSRSINEFLKVKFGVGELPIGTRRAYSDYANINSPNNEAGYSTYGSMRAWTTEVFNTPPILKEVPIPQIHQDNQLLLRVKASSINPIDSRMMEGYGDEAISTVAHMEQNSWNPLLAYKNLPTPCHKSQRLPLIVGRDYSAEVVLVGSKVNQYKPGDEVVGVVPFHWPGCHAEYVLAPANAVVKKPSNLSHLEACALPYTMCTVWSSLVTIARLNERNAKNNRVLIHGGSGGIGTSAIQLLKAWGSPKIVATCSAKNAELVERLGAIALDYNSPQIKEEIIAAGPFEVIFDCVNNSLTEWTDQVMGIWRNCVHVSVVSPLLKDTDRYGIALGLLSTAAKWSCRQYKPALQGRWFSYAYFYPNSDCLREMAHLLEENKIAPIIEKIYSFDEIPMGYEKVGQMHGKGKSVIDFEGVAQNI